MSISHQPCPDCGSSDALLINEDGSMKCFSCDKFTPSPKMGKVTTDNKFSDFIKGISTAIPNRNLKVETVKKYKYNTSIFENRPVQIATYRDLDGNPVFQKIRYTDKKSFKIIGEFEPLLYGMHLFKGNTKKIIITEGEIDCLSISQINNGNPVVSIPNGAQGAQKALKYNLQWLENFKEVILCFDMDEAGQEAIKKCAPLFSTGKCKIMSLPLKDPNEMLKKNLEDELYKAIWNAKEYRPDGIMTPIELWNSLHKKVEWGLSYPFETLTKLTYGIRKNELIVFGGGTGTGKTDFFKEIEYHLINEHKKNVGIIHLEESATDTTLGLMAKSSQIPFHIPDTKYTEEQFKEAFDKTINTNRAFIYNGYGNTDFSYIKSVIRYFAKGCDCEYIFLDHITAFIDGIQNTGDVNQKARNMILELANITRELNICLFVISHLKKSDQKPSYEEGGQIHLDSFYGSSALKQWASFIFGLERNQQHPIEEERKKTVIRCLKDRFTGRALGKTFTTKYISEKGKLVEITDTDEFFNDMNNSEDVF